MTSKPTESELEIMQILWEQGPSTVRRVNDLLNDHRRVGYTTTLKIMQIMADKGLLVRNTKQRSHVYSPSVPSEEVQSDILDHVLKTVFRGSRTDLVMQALGNHHASQEELEMIRKFINNMEEKGNGAV